MIRVLGIAYRLPLVPAAYIQHQRFQDTHSAPFVTSVSCTEG